MFQDGPKILPKPASPRNGRCAASGFTLVELLFVVFIIAMLIAILIPTINKARKQSIAVACLSNLRQSGLLINMYASSHKGKLLYVHWKNPTDWVGFYAWNDVLYRARLVDDKGAAAMSCPLDEVKRHEIGRGYGINFSGRWRNRSTAAMDNVNVFALPFNSYNLAKFEQSTEFVLLADSFDCLAYTNFGFQSNDPHLPSGLPHSWVTFRNDSSNGWIWLRHPNHTANALFADMHAAPITETDVKTLIISNQPVWKD